MKSLIPPVPHRFDHLEIATGDIVATELLFEKLGFCTTQERVTQQLKQKLMIQGRIRVLLTEAAQGTYQYQYLVNNGEGICAVAYHVDSAKKTLNLLKQSKSPVAQEFITEEDDVMFLQTSAVESVAEMRVVFVTRSGAPHDVLSPFAPHFTKVNADPSKNSIGLLMFASIEVLQLSRKILFTFNCQDTAKTKQGLMERGLHVSDNESPTISLFDSNTAAQFLFHFKKI